MKTSKAIGRVTALVCALVALLSVRSVQAHCDGLDGPVIKAAQQALVEGNVDLVLVWVQPSDENEIRQAFENTRTVRELNASARELADRYFFETLVRIHRAGEGAPFTGLKPAGRNLGPAIPLGDEALETRDIEPLVHLLSETMENGLRKHFTEAVEKKKAAAHQGVDAGRAFVKAYVEYIHYVEGLHLATARSAHGHFPDEASATHDEKHAGEE